jgi:tetratricopeptide (TPR) repeat protein
MPQPRRDDALAQLVRAELIYRRGTPPDAEYTFKHALVQDAAYGTLLRDRRGQLHARIAATLEDRFPDIVAAQPALLARHCEEAGLTRKAVSYWLTAGRQAWARSAVAEAVALLRRGLASVPALPDGDERREREFELQIALGQALSANKGWGVSEVGEAYARARQLAVTLNRPRELLFPLSGQWAYHTIRAELNRARQLAAEMRSLGADTGDVAAQLLSRWASAYTSLHLGEFAVAREDVEQGLALFDPADRSFYAEVHSADPVVTLLVISAGSLVLLGRFDQGLSRRDAGLVEARRLSHPHTLALALVWAWGVGWGVGSEPRSLLTFADELLALSTEHGFGHYRAFALMYRGWCLAALGHPDEGIPLLVDGMAGVYDSGFLDSAQKFLTLHADACRMAGQLSAALEHLAEAQRLAEQTEDRWYRAETVRVRGDVLLATGDRAGAEAGYHEAIAIAQQQSGKMWELRAAMSLARLWREQGKLAEARDLLAPVYGRFTEGFGTPILAEAKALLADPD